MGMSLNLNAGSPAERVVMGLAILALCLETFADDVKCNSARAMTVEQCFEVCAPRAIRKVEAWACECEPDSP